METVVSVVLGGGVVMIGIALIVLARSNSSVTPTLVAYGKAQVDAMKGQVVAENERDQWKIRAQKAEAELVAANDLTARTTAKLNEILEEKAHATVEEIRSAPTAADALDVFNELLQGVPGLPTVRPPVETGT